MTQVINSESRFVDAWWSGKISDAIGAKPHTATNTAPHPNLGKDYRQVIIDSVKKAGLDGKLLMGPSFDHRSDSEHSGEGVIFQDNDGTVVIVEVYSDIVIARAWAESIEIAREITTKIVKEIPKKDIPVEKEDLVPVAFWHAERNEASCYIKNVQCPTFAEISENYLSKTRKEIEWLLSLSEPDSQGKIILWHGSPGMGKCVKKDTYIFTSQGMLRIGDLLKNLPDKDTAVEFKTKVQSLAGDENTSHFYNGGVKPCIKITTRRGFSLIATKIHPVLSIKNGSRGWIKTSDLKLGDRVFIKRGGMTFSDTNCPLPGYPVVDVRAKPIKIPSTVNLDFAEWLGWIISEGCFSAKGCVLFCNYNLSVVDRVSKLTESLFGLKMTHNTSSVGDYTIRSVALKDWLKTIGVSGLSAKKVIPDCILRSTKQVQITYLKAAFEAEGSVGTRQRNIEFSSASPIISEQTHLMLLNLGVMSSKSIKPVKLDSGEIRNYWRIVITGDDIQTFKNVIGFPSYGHKQKLLDSIEVSQTGWNLNSIPMDIIETPIRLLREASMELNGGLTPKSSSTIATEALRHRHERGQINLSKDLVTEIKNKYREFSDSLSYHNLESETDETTYWDEVETIEDVGEQDVVDLTLPVTHSFVSNGIMSHNTFCVRALAREWSNKLDATVEVVLDPEQMLGSAGYMRSILLNDDRPAAARKSIKRRKRRSEYLDDYDDFEEDKDSPPLRLIVIEDSAELFSDNCRNTPGFSRLLNLTDGIIGQGLRCIFLLTANEELGKIDPAIRRSGRCLQQLEFPLFNRDYADRWLIAHDCHHVERLATEEISLADLYALKVGQHEPALSSSKFGF
jgi:intein/homing endonuclease